jgi:hypothetical protein
MVGSSWEGRRRCWYQCNVVVVSISDDCQSQRTPHGKMSSVPIRSSFETEKKCVGRAKLWMQKSMTGSRGFARIFTTLAAADVVSAASGHTALLKLCLKYD